MKIRPEILLNDKKEIYYNKILITGSDESFIDYVKDFIISDFKKRKFYIDNSGSYKRGLEGNLFSDKKTLFILNDFPTSGEKDAVFSDGECFLITSVNGKKTNKIKAVLVNEKNSLVVECYKLNRVAKEVVLKGFIEQNNMSVSRDVFWYIVDKMDNNYVMLIKQLEILSLYKNNIDSIKDVEKTLFIESKIELNKVFFDIFNTNKYLVDALEKNINSVSDFYSLLNSIKLYLEIIQSSSSKEKALSKFPRYLFAEKDVFLKIYSLLNKSKSLKVYNQILKAEVLARKNPNLCSVIGLRFFLNLKKTITS